MFNTRFGRRGRLLAAVGGLVALIGVAFGGVVLAQTGGGSGAATPTPTPRGAAPNNAAPGNGQNSGQNKAQRQAQAQQMRDQVLNDLAKNLGVDRAKLDAALKQTAHDQVNAAQQAGKITADQAAKANAAIDSGTFPLGILGRGGFGFGGPHGGPGGPNGLGMALQSCMQNAQNARSQGNDAVANAVKPCLDQAVSAGTITAAQETDILNAIQAGKGPFGGPHRGPGGRPGARPNATPATQ